MFRCQQLIKAAADFRGSDDFMAKSKIPCVLFSPSAKVCMWKTLEPNKETVLDEE